MKSHIFRDRQPCKWTNLPLEFDLVQRQVDDFGRQQPNCLFQHQPFAYRIDTSPIQRRYWILRKYARISWAFSIWRTIPIHRCTIALHCWSHWPMCKKSNSILQDKMENPFSIFTLTMDVKNASPSNAFLRSLWNSVWYVFTSLLNSGNIFTWSTEFTKRI